MQKTLVLASAATGLAAWWAMTRRLRQQGVHCSPLQYARLLWSLRRTSDLIVIADFDRTITTNGTSCHGVLEQCAELSQEYRDNGTTYFQHYHPIEIDPSLTREQKLPLMQEWYNKSHTLLLNEPLTAEVLQRAADTSDVRLRPGFVELLQATTALGIPFVICSAGLGNVVRALLRTRLPAGLDADEIPVVSNWLKFAPSSEGGRICDFNEPLLHMFNKNGDFIRGQLGAERWASLVGSRSTVLLLGDGLGDATMADGIGAACVCRIGFLNESDPARVASRIGKYRAVFDATLVGACCSMAWINHLCGWGGAP